MKIILVCLLFVCSGFANEKIYHEVTKRTFIVEDIEGWTVCVNETVLKDKDWPMAKRIMSNQLFNLKRRLKDEVVTDMQKVKIYVDIKQKGKGGAEYHPSKQWLKNNGFAPEKAQCIEISGIQGFIRYERYQPWVMLHELIHSYHHQVLKFDNKEIIKCYQDIMKKEKYKKTLYVDGRTRFHYSRTDHKEYFAEAAEAYFGVNDYYPFTKGELLQYDPEICKILEKLKRK